MAEQRGKGFASTSLGAVRCENGSWDFTLWAPKRQRVRLHLKAAASGAKSGDQFVPMELDGCGYFHANVEAAEDTKYLYELDGEVERPDPASTFQPDGVHGASQLVDLKSFRWTDQKWKAPPLEESIFYELHIGTYTREGTLAALTAHLNYLAGLGITTVELMPVAQFPGKRNWGYDGVYPYAVQNSYGGPRELQKFVDAAHGHGLAVALDVVYNHLGPEGNYLGEFAPYFSGRYKTPWGDAINYDGPESYGVRQYFIENALYWFENYHIDVLRLDAIHGIFDFGAVHLLAEMQERTATLGEKLGRELILVAESDLNDAKVLRPPESGSYGIPAQWSDDFHHSLHTLLTGERQGYYADFGRLEDMAKTLRDGWGYQWDYSKFRRRRHGNSPKGLPGKSFLVFSQNHDQVGNRAIGDRLSTLTNFESQKLAAGMVLLSPFVPLLFMGEEYGETAPFLYFTDHGDPELVEAVRKGRKHEFVEFGWAEEEIPDPQEPSTFERSVLKRDELNQSQCTLREFYKTLIKFRQANRLGFEGTLEITSDETKQILRILRKPGEGAIAIVANFNEQPTETQLHLDAGNWAVALYSAETRWRGPAQPMSAAEGSAVITLPPRSFIVLNR